MKAGIGCKYFRIFNRCRFIALFFFEILRKSKLREIYGVKTGNWNVFRENLCSGQEQMFFFFNMMQVQ